MVVYTITTQETTSLILWLVAGVAASTDIFRFSSSILAEQPRKDGKPFVNTKHWLQQPVGLIVAGLLHIAVVTTFAAGAWVAWSEAYRSENGGATRCGCIISEEMYLASWILAVITLVVVWLLPVSFYYSRSISNRFVFGVVAFVAGGFAIATMIVYYVIDWQAGLLVTPLVAWMVIVFLAGLFHEIK
jgi:hypothetical protein